MASVHGPVAGYTVRSPMNNASTLCHGAFAGYHVALASLGLMSRISACRSTFWNATVAADVDEVGVDVWLYRAWDLPFMTVDVGVSFGASLLRQTLRTPGVARDRSSGAPSIAVGLGLSTELGRGFYPLVEVAAQTYLYRFEVQSNGAATWTPSPALRLNAGLGKHW